MSPECSELRQGCQSLKRKRRSTFCALVTTSKGQVINPRRTLQEARMLAKK